MKTADGPTLAVLALSQYWKIELYQITLSSGALIYLTSYDVAPTISGLTYLTSVIIKRGKVKQTRGPQVQTLELEMAPQGDAPTPLTVAGLPFLQAVRAGYFDGAHVLYSRYFASSPFDYSHAAVPWFEGVISKANAGRAVATIVVSDVKILLNIQMPRNIAQTGCVHALYDAGCTLSKAAFRSASQTVATASGSSITSSLTGSAAHYYQLGVLTFTSGLANGLSFTIQDYAPAGGVFTFIKPLPTTAAGACAVVAADTFTAVAGCDKSKATCTSKFANGGHFRGIPFMPVPQTLYDGGTVNNQRPLIGGQAGTLGGSRNTSGGGRGYQP